VIGLSEEKTEKLRKSLGTLDWESITYETAYPLIGTESYFGLTNIKYYENKKAIVGFGSKKPNFVANRVFSQIIKTLFMSIRKMLESSYDENIFDARNAIIIEGKIFDNLKDKFQMDADDYKDLRLELYKKRLESVQIFFQPIIDINIQGTIPYIDSFEALARCTIGGKPTLPRDIFETAEKWGEKFKFVLDTKLFLDAINLYSKIRTSTKGIRRIEDERPLAVNIYPQTLINFEFFKLVKEVVSYPRFVQAKNLIIEISEKEGEAVILSRSSIGNNEMEDELEENLSVFSQFRKILKRYVDELGIHFAIDDFGKGNASIARLDALQPSIVKLDRDILLLGKDELKSTVDKIKTRKYLYPVKIVAEGYDKEIKSQLTLADIQSSGVEYIQGYGLTGVPKPRLKRLTDKQREKIKEQYALKKNKEETIKDLMVS
jgi:EAL domain-containing protein (putative c-di-GMP-specific phosphodiesterase class I)